jgi:hypothetical protein
MWSEGVQAPPSWFRPKLGAKGVKQCIAILDILDDNNSARIDKRAECL